jgi:hypothetical protein
VKETIQWVKVSVVSGVLIAGLMSFSHASPDAETYVFNAVVCRYSIKRRQWVEIGKWFCHLAEIDDKPVTKQHFFDPTNASSYYLDARHMNARWQGDYERFARQCEMWILKTLDDRGLLKSDPTGTPIPTQLQWETVNVAFHRWCRDLLLSDVQMFDECQ